MRCLAIIPARGGSKRIPGKNVIDFHGQPLVAHSVATAKAAGIFDDIHVSTESQAIADVVERIGLAVPFLRPDHLSTDAMGLAPVLEWSLKEIERRNDRIYDIVCLLTATAPLIEAQDLRRGRDRFEAMQGRSVLAVARYPSPVEWGFRMEDDGALTAIDPAGLERSSHDHQPAYYDTGTFAFFGRERILRGKATYDDFVGLPIAPWKAVDIDEQEDLEYARLLYSAFRSPSPGKRLSQN